MEHSFYRFDVYRYYFPNAPVYRGCLYGNFKLGDIIVCKKSLLKKEIKLEIPYALYMYEEDGLFYEFFSGAVVGRREPSAEKYTSADCIVRHDYTLTSFRDYGTLDYSIYKLTAAKFAEEVEKFMPYKDHMANEMVKLLHAIDAEYKRMTDAENAKQNAGIQQEKDSQSWLDSIINNR